MFAGAAQEKDENTLAKAYFRWSAEGWNATTKDGEDWPSSGELGYLKSSDDDDTIWYYTASPDFLGEIPVCFSSKLSRRLCSELIAGSARSSECTFVGWII
jgi:hypothetical protein